MPGAFSQQGTWPGWTNGAKGTGTITTTGIKVDRFSQLLVFLKQSAGTGTSPTCNVYLQTLSPDGSTWCDIAAFTQITSGGASKILGFVSAGNAEFPITDGSLAAGTVKAVPLGRQIRLKIVIAGTNPSFTFTDLSYILME